MGIVPTNIASNSFGLTSTPPPCIHKVNEYLANSFKYSLCGKFLFTIIKSFRFEYFLTLLKNSEFIIGNSSAGVREAPIYGVPTINIGNRQKNRFSHESIINVDFNEKKIIQAINNSYIKKFKLSNCITDGSDPLVEVFCNFTMMYTTLSDTPKLLKRFECVPFSNPKKNSLH